MHADGTNGESLRELVADEGALLPLLLEQVVDDASFALDPTGIVASWNEGARRLSGYTHAEIVGQPFGLFFSADEKSAIAPAQLFSDAARTGRAEREGWWQKQDGSRFRVRVVLMALGDSQSAIIGFATVVRDLTRAQRDVRNHPELVRDELTRHEPSDGSSVDEGEVSERDALLRGIMSAPGVLVSVVEIPLLLGDTQPDLRAASRAVLDARHINEVNSAADEDVDYQFVFTSPATASLFKREPASMRGVSAREVGVSAAARANLIRLATEAHHSGRATAGDHLVRQSDGSTRWFSLQLIPLDVADAHRATASEGASRPPRFAVVATDVEARVQLEHQLRQSQKMEAIGRLAGGVAHDFNNMLTAITGFTRFALYATPPGSTVADDLNEVLSAADRAASLTRGLLAFSRQQVLQMTPLDLNAVITKLAPMLHRLIGEDVALELALSDVPVRVMADATQLDQVIMNLVVNARDAMPNGGRVLIETSVTDVSAVDGEVTASSEQVAARSVVMAISDTGSGMTTETRARLFEPFFTTKAVGMGTGLGLSTVFGIVQQSGGKITVYSELGFGATFKVYLPFLAEPNESTSGGRSESRTLQPQMGSGRVLLVEDDAAVRTLAARALSSAGYTVLEAKNGREGNLLARVAHESLACIVTDLVMPDMGGRDMMSSLEAEKIQIPVVFVSGYTAQTLTRRALLRQDAFFLEKPFTMEKLLERVAEAIQRAAEGKG